MDIENTHSNNLNDEDLDSGFLVNDSSDETEASNEDQVLFSEEDDSVIEVFDETENDREIIDYDGNGIPGDSILDKLHSSKDNDGSILEKVGETIVNTGESVSKFFKGNESKTK